MQSRVTRRVENARPDLDVVATEIYLRHTPSSHRHFALGEGITFPCRSRGTIASRSEVFNCCCAYTQWPLEIPWLDERVFASSCYGCDGRCLHLAC